jgi:cytochrome c oxidase assembly factor CtaG
VLTLPFHAFLGITLMQQEQLVAGDWYHGLADRTGLQWLPDPDADQHLAGGILWSSGDLVGLLFFLVLFVQWVRSSMREAEREDRRLDRLEEQDRLRTQQGSLP